VIRWGKKLRPVLDRWLASRSLVPNQPVLEAALFAWTERLRGDWRTVQQECDALLKERDSIPPLGEISPYHRKVAPDDRWRSYFFEAHGYCSDANRARCPRTAALLDTIPDLVTAFFSVMDPGTHVPRHKGFTKALLNVHLGLRIPAGVESCRIQIDGQDHGWREGELLIIDDTYPHEVWNQSQQSRALLFIQVLRPMTPPARMLGQLIVSAMNLTPYVRDARRALNGRRVRRRSGRISLR
jgi:beta-hydroxylase